MIINRGDLFTANLSPVVGSEQEGIRPVLIIQNDIGNRYSPTTIIAPLTSKSKNYLPTPVPVEADCLPKDSIILLEQIKTIDKRRLMEYLGKLDKETLKLVDKAILKSLDVGEERLRLTS